MVHVLLGAVLLASPPDAGASSEAHPPGRLITVLGKRVWVEEEGNGPPLLLIPGGPGGSHDYFHPWLRPLSRHFRVVAFDGYGRGRSDRAARPAEYSFRRDVQEVEALRSALGLERLAVLGHSYGGFVAQAYALEHPERVSHLVLSNAMLRGRDWQRANEGYNRRLAAAFPDLWVRVEALRRAGVREQDPRLQAAYGDRFPQQLALFYFHDRHKAALVVPDASTFNQDLYLAVCGPDCDFQLGASMLGVDFGARLAGLRRPLLAIAGRADGIVTPALVQEFQRAVPGAPLVIFEESGHFPFIEEPERYLQVLGQFLGSVPER